MPAGPLPVARFFAGLRRLVQRFCRRSASLDDAPLNKASLLVIVLVDLFLLTNIFIGLDDIGRRPLSPQQAFPCQQEWSAYRSPARRGGAGPDDPGQARERKVALLRRAVPVRPAGGAPFDPGRASLADPDAPSFRDRAVHLEADHLGRVDPACLRFADHQDRIAAQPALPGLVRQLDAARSEIGVLEQTNAGIRSQYDSALLEQIAGQPRSRSIHPVSAAEARRSLERNEVRITALNTRVDSLEAELIADPASRAFLAFLDQKEPYAALSERFRHALFWAPSLRLLFQGLFLLPLVLLALIAHRLASRRGHGLIALISWHLLVISLIPLLLKLFEFAQVGALFTFVFELVRALFGNLLFLVSYLYILLIPLVGFGLIRLMQNVLFNTRLQAAARLQKSRCLRCARRLQAGSSHCPHCGYAQLRACGQCRQPTHRHLPYCRHCGTPQPEVAPEAAGRERP